MGRRKEHHPRNGGSPGAGHRRPAGYIASHNICSHHAYHWSAASRFENSLSEAWELEPAAGMDLVLLAPCLLAVGLYLNTLTAEFAYDDSRAILKNQDLLPETPLFNLFYDDFWGTPLTHSGSHKSYRPLCVLTFRFNHALWGQNPAYFHATNVLLHTVVTGLFTYIAKLLLQRTLPVLLAGMLFAAHPIHTEAVAGVVGRADILACLFFLLAFLCYITYCNRRETNHRINNVGTSTASGKDANHVHITNIKAQNHNSHKTIPAAVSASNTRWLSLVGTAVFTAMALLSKEQGVTVLAICAVYDVFLHCKLSFRDIPYIFKKKYRSLLEGLASLATIGIAFIGLRIYFMGNKPPEFAPADNPASDSDSLLTRTLTYYYLPFVNFWLLLFPKTLSFDWSMGSIPLLESVLDLRNLCTLTFYGLLLYVVYCLLKYLNVEDTNVDKDHLLCNGNGVLHDKSHNPSASFTPNTNNKTVLARRRAVRRGSDSSTDSCHSVADDNQHHHNNSSHHGYQQNLRVLVLSLAILVVPFIPATNLFFYVGFVIAERVLYIPSMGFCLLVSQGAYVMQAKYCSSDKKRHLLHAVLVCLIVSYGVRTVARNQDWQTEENLYRAGIYVNPAKAWGNLANILNGQGKVAEAEESYKNALRHRANMADVHYNLGILLQEQKRYKEAVDSYQMAIQCRPKLTMAHLNLGIVYSNLGLQEEADKIYRHCALIDTTGLKDPRLHEQTKISALYNLGRLLADQDLYWEAIEVYKEAILKRPSHYAPQSLYNMLGEAYFKLDDLEQAEYWYKEALRAKAEHVPAHLTMAKLHHRRGNLEKAEDWFLKARFLDPEDGSVYQHYGQFLGDTDRHQEAADNYLQAAKRQPEDFELIFNTANALRQAARNVDAEQFYKKAALLRPEMATAHMNLGAMLHFNNKLTEAEQSYLAALRLKPNDVVTQTNLKKLRNLIQKSKDKLKEGKR